MTTVAVYWSVAARTRRPSSSLAERKSENWCTSAPRGTIALAHPSFRKPESSTFVVERMGRFRTTASRPENASVAVVFDNPEYVVVSSVPESEVLSAAIEYASYVRRLRSDVFVFVEDSFDSEEETRRLWSWLRRRKSLPDYDEAATCAGGAEVEKRRNRLAEKKFVSEFYEGRSDDLRKNVSVALRSVVLPSRRRIQKF